MISNTEQQIIALLEHKQTINQFTDNHRWLIEAVELLLRCQLEFCEELKNAGILR